MPAVDIDLRLIAPLVVLAVGSLLPVTVDLMLPARRGLVWWYITVLGALGLAGGYLWSLWPEAAAGASTFFGAFLVDRFSLLFSAMILVATAVAVLLSMTRTEDDVSGYLSLVLLAALGMLVLAGAGNLMGIFLGLEVLSLSLYVLVGFPRNDPAAKEAALKYFILGSVASGFVLYGFALIYGAVGGIGLDAIRGYWLGTGAAGVGLLFKAGLALTVVGFAFKLALVPFHAWSPDAYQGAPAAVTAFMAIGTKAAAFAALLRFLVSAVPGEVHWAYLTPLMVLALLSMFGGSLAALAQSNLKRLLAYSGIAHAGYLVIALPGLTEAGATAAIFYLTAYAFMSLGAFGVIIWLDRAGERGDELASYAGLFYRRPLLAVVMFVFLLSLAGMPPTGGFIGKFMLARVAVDQGAWLLLAGLILTTGISAYAYLRVVRAMFLQGDQLNESRGRRRRAMAVAGAAPSAGGVAGPPQGSVAVPSGVVGFTLGLALALSVTGTLLLGLWPQGLLALTQHLSILP